MARSHSHSVKLGEAKKTRRRKRLDRSVVHKLRMPDFVAVAWVCNDASCVAPHGSA